MGILEDISRRNMQGMGLGLEKGTDVLGAMQTGTKMAQAEQEMQMRAIKMQAFSEASKIKRKSRKAMESADLSSIDGTREASRKLFEAGDVEGGLALEKDADNQEYQSEKLALDKRKLDILEQSWKDRKDIAALKNTGNARFKKATIAQMKSTGAMLVNDETFNSLESDYQADYAAHITQAVADYMEAARASGIKLTGTMAFDAVSRFAQGYVQREGMIFGVKNPLDNDKFDAESFRRDFNQGLPTMMGLGEQTTATSEGMVTKDDTTKKEVNNFMNTILGTDK